MKGHVFEGRGVRLGERWKWWKKRNVASKGGARLEERGGVEVGRGTVFLLLFHWVIEKLE